MINRGNYRRDLFRAKGAADSFVSCLLEAAERFGWRLHAYVVMSNHFHLAVETPEPNLSDGMKWLQGTWARRFNEFRRERGRPFQGRYKALHVEPGHSLAQVAHYIHLNPVRAKIVPAEQLLDYRWSSLVRFLAHERPRVLVAEVLLRECGDLKDTRTGWRHYLEYLKPLAQEDAGRRKEQFGRLSRGWVIGSDQFRDALKQDLQAASKSQEERFEIAGGDRAAYQEVRSLSWEETLQALARRWKISLEQLNPKASDPEKVKLAAGMKLATSVSNGWLAERLGMGPPATVSQYVRRFRLRGLDQGKDFQAALAKVKS